MVIDFGPLCTPPPPYSKAYALVEHNKQICMELYINLYGALTIFRISERFMENFEFR